MKINLILDFSLFIISDYLMQKHFHDYLQMMLIKLI